jgi:cardiolipin synthase
LLLAVALTFFATILVGGLILGLTARGFRVDHRIVPVGEIGSDEFRQALNHLLGPPLIGGNKVTHLRNGDEIFPAMLGALKGAQKSITLETFIYWSGAIGKQFAEVLSERSKSGVKVHVMLDWIGSRNLQQSAVEEMKAAGVRIKRFRPPKWYTLLRLNNRTHRKLLVIDGKIGFTGGVGIADLWTGHAQDPEHWRDSHFKVEGPAVNQLQAAFLDNWNATDNELLHGESYFPRLPDVGQSLAQVFKSSPEEGSSSVRLMYLYSIAHARSSIFIANAYFVPDAFVRSRLIEAARRGVDVQIVLPGKKTDTAITRYASRKHWGRLLAAGIKIYEYEPTMFHCKYMTVDGLWASVGSTNFDSRSFRLNAESNLNVLDRPFAEAMNQVFESDKASSQLVTLAKWKRRNLKQQFFDFLASLFERQV